MKAESMIATVNTVMAARKGERRRLRTTSWLKRTEPPGDAGGTRGYPRRASGPALSCGGPPETGQRVFQTFFASTRSGTGHDTNRLSRPGSCRRSAQRRAVEVVHIDDTGRLLSQTEADRDGVRGDGGRGKRQPYPAARRARREGGAAHPALPLVIRREPIGDPAQRRQGRLRVCLIVQRELIRAALRDVDGALAEVSLDQQLGGRGVRV